VGEELLAIGRVIKRAILFGFDTRQAIVTVEKKEEKHDRRRREEQTGNNSQESFSSSLRTTSRVGFVLLKISACRWVLFFFPQQSIRN